MARALRTDFSGAVHHVTSRGNERRPIFVDDRDREMFLQFLGRAVVRFGWSLAAYVLMTNHFRWSSYRATAGLENAPEWLDTTAALTPFAPDPALAQSFYRDFVEQRVGSQERLWDKVVNGIYPGTETWRRKMRKFVESPREMMFRRLLTHATVS